MFVSVWQLRRLWRVKFAYYLFFKHGLLLKFCLYTGKMMAVALSISILKFEHSIPNGAPMLDQMPKLVAKNL